MAKRTLARVEKKALNEGWTLLFLDESAFYLLPGVVHTWAPKGQTPILRCRLSREHYSVISAVTPEGDLYLHLQDTPFDSAGVIAFLEQLLAQIPGKLLVIWDGAPIHRSKTLRTFLAEGAAARLWLERLPGYAPELNPDEGIWQYLKRVELKNVCCQDMAELKHKLITAVTQLRQKPHIIKACFAHLNQY